MKSLYCRLILNDMYFKNIYIETHFVKVSSWPRSYGSWNYNYLCNQCLSPLMLWVRISISARCKTLCDKDCQYLATGPWFSPGPPVSSTNKTDCHDITEILLALNTIKQTNKQTKLFLHFLLLLITPRLGEIKLCTKVYAK
jgi:hypothetical protein